MSTHAALADVVIVGAGSAGCLLAERLSRDGALRVVLLEAGPRDLVTASVAAGLIAAGRGADVLRVHDVRPTREALTVEASIKAREPAGRPHVRAAGSRG